MGEGEGNFTLNYHNKTLLYRSRYSRMDQVKFVEDSLLKNFTWSILEYLDPYIS